MASRRAKQYFVQQPWQSLPEWQKLTSSRKGFASHLGALEKLQSSPTEAMEFASSLSHLPLTHWMGTLPKKASRFRLGDHNEMEAIAESSLPDNRFARLANEYNHARKYAMARTKAKQLKARNMTAIGHHHYGGQFVHGEDSGLKEALLGSSGIDASIMTCDLEWFKLTDLQIETFLDFEHACATKIVCQGTDPNDPLAIIQMWQMITTAHIGCVVSVLGEDDIQRASWACLDANEMTVHHVDTKLEVWVESQDVSEILPRELLAMYKNLVGVIAVETSGRLYVDVRLLRCKINKNASQTVVHIMVRNWTDMIALLKPQETFFLYHLALFINGVANTPDAFENSNTHRQVFHCSAGCGRSVVVLASTLLCEPKVGALNSNIYDMMVQFKKRRLHAINCLEHYLSLDLLLVRALNRPILIAATEIADVLQEVESKQDKNKMRWAIVACLRDVSHAAQNIGWYKTLFQ